MLQVGLYERVLDEALAKVLEGLPAEQCDRRPIDEAELPKVLAQYVAAVVQRGLEEVAERHRGAKRLEQRREAQVALVNALIAQVRARAGQPADAAPIVWPTAEQLLGVLDGSQVVLGAKAKELTRPESSLAQSSLFTGAPGEPQLAMELNREIESADRIDWLVSFIRPSGVSRVIDTLRTFTEHGKHVRILTTTYVGATDASAVRQLARLRNTEVRISYDTDRTRLHAKAYLFHRDTGFSTAYVGSSNLSGAAITSGMEWNVKVTRQDLPETFEKIAATFESYWNDGAFEPYDGGEEAHKRLCEALKVANRPKSMELALPMVFRIAPYPFQQEVLDALEAERTLRGHHRNLVVAATGTGKTVIAAFDYKRFCEGRSEQACKLLFVAHRKEILEQALMTFRGILRNQNFGSLFVGDCPPSGARKDRDHLFASISLINSRKLFDSLPRNYFDYIVVDETHHAPADTYRKLLEHFEPRILLGLTATPERMDGDDILEFFDHRVAAEIRLPEAINRELLCPFQYFGITDVVNLKDVRWARGGYDRQALADLYMRTAASRARHIIESLNHYIPDRSQMKALGFCVSVEHAKFMAKAFNEAGIPSIALSGKSDDKERDAAQARLGKGEIQCIFTVDLYNEGVDIPEVNTVLFLRPTESLTVFLQQLGRGLRKAEGKECLTVLDFIGQANQHYDFESRFRALLPNGGKDVRHAIDNGFPYLPKGCFIRLEEVAQEHILETLSSTVGGCKTLLKRLSAYCADTGKAPTLEGFLKHFRMDPRALYRSVSSFARLCAMGNLRAGFKAPFETKLQRALYIFSVADDPAWITFLLEALPRLGTLDVAALPLDQRRMMQMFYATIWCEGVKDWNNAAVRDNLRALSDAPILVDELCELLRVRLDAVRLRSDGLELGVSDCPLALHRTYTRDQLLTALDILNPATVREGVKWLPEKRLDLLFITLKKSEKDYSESTRYNDYAINETLFHWQSQSTTSETSETGRRYVNHRERGSRVVLFVREAKYDVFGKTAAYTCLGTAQYVSHTVDSRTEDSHPPMSITWRLDAPIPAQFLPTARQLVG